MTEALGTDETELTSGSYIRREDIDFSRDEHNRADINNRCQHVKDRRAHGNHGR